jgi:hypothetical protein
VIPLVDRGMTSVAMVSDPAIAAPLHDCLDALVVAVAHSRQGLASQLSAEGGLLRP